MNKKNKCILTISKEEYEFSPIWYNYYRNFFDPQDMYNIDNGGDAFSKYEINNIKPVEYKNLSTHEKLRKSVTENIENLLRKYNWVFFTEIDEIIAFNTNVYKNFDDILKEKNNQAMIGYHVIQRDNEKPFDENLKILQQRSFWTRDKLYDKTLILNSKVDYCLGFHTCQPASPVNPNLYLIHLHYFDESILFKKLNRTRNWKWENEPDGVGIQNKCSDDFIKSKIKKLIDTSEPIPDFIKNNNI